MRIGLAVAALVALSPGIAFAAGDPAAGEKVYAQCRACHQIGPTAKNAVGPVHNGLIGRKAGTYPGYTYSEANKNSGITWTEEAFKKYIKDPKADIPGTKMVFPGLKNDKQIDDILAYIEQFDDKGNKKTN